ncbi:hypothetical protein INR49_029899 [Caranx melampygus]|nr:hypothetical protein INR49_029899 [Caranx melampygus]
MTQRYFFSHDAGMGPMKKKNTADGLITFHTSFPASLLKPEECLAVVKDATSARKCSSQLSVRPRSTGKRVKAGKRDEPLPSGPQPLVKQDWLSHTSLRQLQEKVEAENQEARELIRPLLDTENGFMKELERFLSKRDVAELRRKELLHKRWTECVWFPLQKRVEEQVSSCSPLEAKRRQSLYNLYLHHCNTKATLTPLLVSSSSRKPPVVDKTEGRQSSRSLTLDVALDPLQPVRVLLLPDPFVDLRAQLLSSLQSFFQGPAVCMAIWCVLQDLNDGRMKVGETERATGIQAMNIRQKKLVFEEYCNQRTFPTYILDKKGVSLISRPTTSYLEEVFEVGLVVGFALQQGGGVELAGAEADGNSDWLRQREESEEEEEVEEEEEEKQRGKPALLSYRGKKKNRDEVEEREGEMKKKKDCNYTNALQASVTYLQFPEPPAGGVLSQDHDQLPWRQLQLMHRWGDGGADCLGDLC